MTKEEFHTYVAEQAGIALDVPEMGAFWDLIADNRMQDQLDKLVNVVADKAVEIYQVEDINGSQI